MFNILIISPYFLPFAGVGANRMTSLAKFLQKDKDFNVTVLKNNICSYGNNVINTYDLGNVETIECDVEHSFGKNINLYKNKLKELLAIRKYDCVVISVGPFYTLPLVKLIKRIGQIPVVLDIRDFWAHEPVSKDIKTGKLFFIKSIFKDIKYERPAIRHADVVVVMDNPSISFLEQIYHRNNVGLTIAIPNGYDEDALCKHASTEYETKSKQYQLVVYGKFAEYIAEERLNSFIDAIKICKEWYPEISIVQVGHGEEKLMESLKAQNIVYTNTGYLEYASGIEYLKSNANVLLLSGDLIGLGYGTKIYDYIYCNKPIVFIGNRNAGVVKLLSKFQNAFICESKIDVVYAMQRIEKESITKLDNGIDISMYSRKTQNYKYKQLLIDTIKRGKQSER